MPEAEDFPLLTTLVIQVNCCTWCRCGRTNGIKHGRSAQPGNCMRFPGPPNSGRLCTRMRRSCQNRSC
ncbi:hypothetical protein WJX75_001875 [Coccomyxa subellipsoidea]|uniref:Uncharacterized protein n=1 Tax=Coccomyxa subellipsoidea TaxID=248742 RepID=A0ABR2YCR4_9CHLO